MRINHNNEYAGIHAVRNMADGVSEEMMYIIKYCDKNDVNIETGFGSV